MEVLVWILIATAGGYNGSSFLQPLYFKDVAQCEHVAKNMSSMYAVNAPRCIQARIYAPATPKEPAA